MRKWAVRGAMLFFWWGVLWLLMTQGCDRRGAGYSHPLSCLCVDCERSYDAEREAFLLDAKEGAQR